MVVFKFDPAETGLRKTLKEYEEIALRYIWSLGDARARKDLEDSIGVPWET